MEEKFQQENLFSIRVFLYLAKLSCFTGIIIWKTNNIKHVPSSPKRFFWNLNEAFFEQNLENVLVPILFPRGL